MKKLNAAELRIGNYVNAEIGLQSLDLHTIKSIDIRDIEKGIAEVYGVKLTHEWLERANGCTLEPFGYHIRVSDRDAWQINQREGIWVLCGMIASYIEIQYVHQLQNLYWCLCGQELTFKPTQL